MKKIVITDYKEFGDMPGHTAQDVLERLKNL